MGSVKKFEKKDQTISVNPDDLKSFEEVLRGKLLRQGDEGYDEARTIWNAMIDRKPAYIVRCGGVADIIRSVNFARENSMLLAVRGGGHNIAGSAICDDGLVIDLSQMRSVRIDSENRIAHVEPGATLGDFDHEALAFGMATPLGINSTTGVAGLTLGGGFGWLSRRHGMTVDNLLAADVVTADGRFITASKDKNSDLFWGLRGGGGNFGVVTRFEFQLHPVRKEQLCGLVFYGIDDAVEALKKYRDFVETLGDDTAVWGILRQAPPLPFLPEDVHGKEVLAFAMFHAGDPEEGRKILEPVRDFGKVVGEFIAEIPYTAWQQVFDPLLTPGARNYWKTHNFTNLGNEIIEAAVEFTKRLPSPQSELFFGSLGRAAGRVPQDETAYYHRKDNFIMNMHGRWEDPADDSDCVKSMREFFNSTSKYATGGAYINFLTQDEKDRLQAAYGPAYNRLLEVKKAYDPENLFAMNHNIDPNG
ncbi:MAG: FAD-binding protein [candidate division Zixibacteria bacterium]|nr:FAD-binding protein [candidate division Zixibacteria bacterium]